MTTSTSFVAYTWLPHPKTTLQVAFFIITFAPSTWQNHNYFVSFVSIVAPCQVRLFGEQMSPPSSRLFLALLVLPILLSLPLVAHQPLLLAVGCPLPPVQGCNVSYGNVAPLSVYEEKHDYQVRIPLYAPMFRLPSSLSHIVPSHSHIVPRSSHAQKTHA